MLDKRTETQTDIQVDNNTLHRGGIKTTTKTRTSASVNGSDICVMTTMNLHFYLQDGQPKRPNARTILVWPNVPSHNYQRSEAAVSCSCEYEQRRQQERSQQLQTTMHDKNNDVGDYE